MSTTTSRRWSDCDGGTERSSVPLGDAVFIHASIIRTATVAACATPANRAIFAKFSFARSSSSDAGMKQIGPGRFRHEAVERLA